MFAVSINNTKQCHEEIYPNVKKYNTLKEQSKSKEDFTKYKKIESHYQKKFDDCIESMRVPQAVQQTFRPYRSNANSVEYKYQF